MIPTITYTDLDGDVVTIADYSDFEDIVYEQKLNPVHMTLTVSTPSSNEDASPQNCNELKTQRLIYWSTIWAEQHQIVLFCNLLYVRVAQLLYCSVLSRVLLQILAHYLPLYCLKYVLIYLVSRFRLQRQQWASLLGQVCKTRNNLTSLIYYFFLRMSLSYLSIFQCQSRLILFTALIERCLQLI